MMNLLKKMKKPMNGINDDNEKEAVFSWLNGFETQRK